MAEEATMGMVTTVMEAEAEMADSEDAELLVKVAKVVKEPDEGTQRKSRPARAVLAERSRARSVASLRSTNYWPFLHRLCSVGQNGGSCNPSPRNRLLSTASRRPLA